MGWNLSAALTVLLPLLLSLIAHRTNNNGDENNQRWWRWGSSNNGEDDNEEGANNDDDDDGNYNDGDDDAADDDAVDDDGNYNNGDDAVADDDEERRNLIWWWWGKGEEEEGGQDEARVVRGRRALIFVYIWSLFIFAYLVWIGNRALGNNGNDKQHQILLMGLIVFANLAFVCSILVGCLGFEEENDRDGGWLNEGPADMVLTYVLWTIFAMVFSIILYLKVRRGGKSSSTNSDYRRHDGYGLQ